MSTNCGLTEAYSYILFALVEPMHGYGIMQKVEEMSGGTFSLGPGTLYAAIQSIEPPRVCRRVFCLSSATIEYSFE